MHLDFTNYLENTTIQDLNYRDITLKIVQYHKNPSFTQLHVRSRSRGNVGLTFRPTEHSNQTDPIFVTSHLP